MYGFHKVNKTPRGQRGSIDQQSWEFTHPKFIRGRPDLLESIKRKTIETDTPKSLKSSNPDINGPFISASASSSPVIPSPNPNLVNGNTSLRNATVVSSPVRKEGPPPPHMVPTAAPVPRRAPNVVNQRGSPPHSIPVPPQPDPRQNPTAIIYSHLDMISIHQNEVAHQLGGVQDTCEALYRMLLEERRKQDTLIELVGAMYKTLQQSGATCEFEFSQSSCEIMTDKNSQ